MSSMTNSFTVDFEKNGFAVIPQVIPAERCDVMQRAAQAAINTPTQPYELEAALGYPGAPVLESLEGQTTIRRLKSAYSRAELWREWAHDPTLLRYVADLLGSHQISLTQAHHNCLMTKAPHWSSQTGWHQDIRYWSFEVPFLVTAWLPLTNEFAENGCLHVIPGSHTMHFKPEQYDQLKFFRDDLPENQRLISTARPVALRRGDLLLFDARLLHCAGKNTSDSVKLSLVFTYKKRANQAITNTRSSAMPEVDMTQYVPDTDTSV